MTQKFFLIQKINKKKLKLRKNETNDQKLGFEWETDNLLLFN